MSNVSATPTVLQRLVRDLRINLDSADRALSQIHDTASTNAEVLTDDLRATIRQLRADVGHSLAELEATTGDQRSAYLDEVRRRLNAGRGALDELRVRASLGGDQVRQQSALLVDATENAWLAARNRLSDAQHVASDALDGSRIGVEKSLQDFNDALVEARAAFQRSRQG